MFARNNSVWCIFSIILVTLLAACNKGPSDAEFIAACIKEGTRGVNKRLSEEMGVTREAFCACAAKEAASSLSTDARRWMIEDMQGNQPEALAIQAKMNDAEQMALVNAGVQILGKCAEKEKKE